MAFEVNDLSLKDKQFLSYDGAPAGSQVSVSTVGATAPSQQDRGAYGFSGHTFIGSFTGSYLMTPGTGSKIILKGFTASAELASKFRLIFSGAHTDAGLISTFNLPNSGTVSMNMIGMEPSGAVNLPIGVGKSDTVSLHITFFTQDTLWFYLNLGGFLEDNGNWRT